MPHSSDNANSYSYTITFLSTFRRALRMYAFLQVLVSQRLNNTPVLGWILRMLEFPGLGDCYQVRYAVPMGYVHIRGVWSYA